MTDSSPFRESPAGSAWRIAGRLKCDSMFKITVADVVYPLAKNLLLELRELGCVAVHDRL